jgi:proline iminopeptidase
MMTDHGAVRTWTCGLCLLVLLCTARWTGAADPEKGNLFKGKSATIYYEIRGGGNAPPLFIANGGPGFDHMYLHISAAWDTLAKHRAVVFWDQRGNGRSPALAQGQSCTLGDQIDDMDALRTSLGYGKIDLIGHSWGGYLAMAYAARHPEAIDKLIICDSAAPKWADTVFLFKDIFPEKVGRQEAVAFAEELGDSSALRTDLHEYLSMLCFSAEKRDRMLEKARDFVYRAQVNKTLNADLARYDMNPELPKYRFPCLVITGRYDFNVAPSVAYKISKAIPGSRFVVFESSGHLPFYEEPDRFVQVVEEFLSSP